jgi:probable HAF family extracellular repeat protein
MQHGFLLDSGNFTTLDYPGAIHTNAFGINNAGDIVGTYFTAPNAAHGFLLMDGVFTSIDFPGAVRTEVLGINSRGEIVGDYTDTANRIHGFVARRVPEPNSLALLAGALFLLGLQIRRMVR